MNYIIISGPQAAGKSTTINYLKEKYNNSGDVLFLEETRCSVQRKLNPTGCLTATRNLEIKLIENDLERLRNIEGNKQRYNVCVDECNIFTLAHAKLYDINIGNVFREYMNSLEKLNAKIIFLDVPPETSWDRRKGRYEKRIKDFSEDEKKSAMNDFKKYMDYVYPNIIQMFKNIELPKIRINNELNQNDSLGKIEKIFLNIINRPS